MTTEPPLDRSTPPNSAAQLKLYTQQRMKGAWFRVVWSAALVLVFAATLTRRLEEAQKNDGTNGLIVFTLLVLGRFSYYLYRLIKARRDVEQMKRSLGVFA